MLTEAPELRPLAMRWHRCLSLGAAVTAPGAAAKVGPCLQGSVLFMETFEGLEGEHSPCSGNVHGVKAWC